MPTNKAFPQAADRPTPAAVAELLTRHRPGLYGYILACVRQHADAEDVFQEVALAVIQSIGSLQSEDEFSYWAREIARRRVLAHFRRAGRENVHDPDQVRRLAEAAERVEDVRPTPERQAALLACLESLPEHSRRLIALRYDPDSGGAEELARQLGRSVQAVYAMVKRIKASLRACAERRLAQESDPAPSSRRSG
jgi:RNA polymerase sigma-70 factor (ECF subfamily)